MAGTAKPAKAPPPSLKKSTSSQSAKNQSSIASFFQRKPTGPELGLPVNGVPKKTAASSSPKASVSTSSLTPAPSSDAPEYEDDTPVGKINGEQLANGLPSPVTPAAAKVKNEDSNGLVAPKGFYSPSRKVGSDILSEDRGGWLTEAP